MNETATISKSKLIALYKSEAVRVYEDEKYLVVQPKTHESMCIYGYGATWCVTSSDHYIFEGYNTNPMFVIIIKGSKVNGYQEKYLCQFETHGIVDNQTQDVEYADFFDTHKTLVGVFQDVIANDKCKKYSDYEKDYFASLLTASKKV